MKTIIIYLLFTLSLLAQNPTHLLVTHAQMCDMITVEDTSEPKCIDIDFPGMFIFNDDLKVVEHITPKGSDYYYIVTLLDNYEKGSNTLLFKALSDSGVYYLFYIYLDYGWMSCIPVIPENNKFLYLWFTKYP